MGPIKETDFRKEIKTAPRAGYLFFGEEDYLKAFSVRTARECICPEESFAIFNEIRMEALDFTPGKLLEALMPLPMMQERKLVVVSGLNFVSMSQSDLDALCEVLALLPEYDYNTLIFNVPAEGFDMGYFPKRPSSAYLKLSEFLTFVEFERSSTAKLCAWIQKHFAHNGITASADLCREMAEYCGHSMFVLANEIDKLSFYLLAHQKNEATVPVMHEVCIPANEYDAFAFTNAIMEGQADVALGILSDYKRRRMEPIAIFGEVARVISEMSAVAALSNDGVPAGEIASALKIHEFRVGLYQKSLRNSPKGRIKRALDACGEADASLKLSPQGFAPLERLICAI